jgi:CRISPR-associated protein Csa1
LPAARQQIVTTELRGWSWNEAPMQAPYSIQLGVYEVANKYCSTGKDIWWRRVRQVRADANSAMVEGQILHSVVARVISESKRLIWHYGIDRPTEIISALRKFDKIWLEKEALKSKNCPPIDELSKKAEAIWNYETSVIEARLRESLSRQPYAKEDSIVNSALPIVIEQRLDGSLIGLSRYLSMDAYQSAEPMILELKFGERKPFHRLQVTGYALVAESLHEFPLNIGCIVYPKFMNGSVSVEKDFFLIDEELRQQFLEERDEKMRMVFEEIDPGLMKNCPKECPYFKHCYQTNDMMLSSPVNRGLQFG